MIMREWRGWVKNENLAAYLDYQARTGIVAYASTPGNLGQWALTRRDGERTEVITLSLWEDEASIRAFAGAEAETARFFPEDERFLVERWTRARHYQVHETP